MSRDLDAAIGTAHELTREKTVIQAPVAAKVPVKAGAPTVKVDKSGRRVRLRQIDHALEGCISSRSGEERFRLEPNVWTTVSEDVYTMLRDKFDQPQEFETINWNGSSTNPQREIRKESHQEYVIEFPEA